MITTPHSTRTTSRLLSLRALSRRRGASAAEMAMILPILLLITFGIVEVGWYLHLAQVVHNAARQGARAAVRLENSNSEVEAVVHNCLANDAHITSAATTVQIHRLDWAGQEQYQVSNLDENEQGQPVRVVVTVDYSQMGTLTNLLGLRGGNLSSYAVMQRHN